MIAAAPFEQSVGMRRYATAGPPCTARAKSSPEDFRVEEQLLESEISPAARRGYYPLYRIEKRSIDTIHMAKELGTSLKSRVSYAGLKDKMSVATQYATPTSLRSEVPSKVTGRCFVATLMGFVPAPLSRSALVGNRFEVVLRGCCPEIEARVGEAMRLGQGRGVPNYYGLQRFGTGGAGTHRVGKALVMARFEDAVKLLLLGGGQDARGGKAAREAFSAGEYEEGIRLLPPGKDLERLVARELGRHPGQWVRALRAVPVKVRRLYVNAYQSLIFNKTLSSALESGEDISRLEKGDNWAATAEGGLVTLAPRGVRDTPVEGAVPMVQVVGYAHRNYGSRFDGAMERVLKEEEVTPGQFYVKDMQELSSEGGFRRPHLALRDASWGVEGGEAKIVFTLAKGQYATVLLREIIKPKDPVEAGLA